MSSPSRKLQKIQKANKVKVGQYNCTYLKFGFTTAPHDATHPRGNEAESTPRPPNRMHPNKISSDFKKLRNEKTKQTTIRSLFRQTDKRQEYGLMASYNISY